MSFPVVGSDDDNHTKSPRQFLIRGDEEAFFGWLRSNDCVSNFAGEGEVLFVDVCWSLGVGSVQQTPLKGAAEFAKEAVSTGHAWGCWWRPSRAGAMKLPRV
jgi:hypothetical protein